jgi:hypothetical protein
MNMPNSANEFLAEIAAKVAASDAKADADLADILAGRPMKKRTPAPKAAAEAGTSQPVARKPRARRKPKTAEPS